MGRQYFSTSRCSIFPTSLRKIALWINGQQVFDSLFLFVKLSKRYLNEGGYRIMISSFMNSYLGSQGRPRLEIMRRGHKPMPKEAVVEHLL